MQVFKKTSAAAARPRLVGWLAVAGALAIAGCRSGSPGGTSPVSTSGPTSTSSMPTAAAPPTTDVDTSSVRTSVAAATSSAPTTSAPAMTRSDFLARADAICNDSNAQLGNLARAAFGDQRPSVDQWRTFAVAKVIPLVGARLDAIQALGSPEGGADAVGAILAAGRSAVTMAQQDPQLLSPASSAPFDRFDQLATAYGLAACAVGG